MKYLIWSNEHGAWWRAAKLGYTTVIADAGRYDEQEARTICDDANRYLPAGAQPNEVMVPAPEALSDLQGKAERLCGCSSTQAFLALSDEQKARWFVTTGQRDKWARERIEQLEAENQALREALPRLVDRAFQEGVNCEYVDQAWASSDARLEADALAQPTEGTQDHE